MAKPPFKFKANKPAAASTVRVELTGTDEVPALYSDVFVVVNEADTGLGSIYFYQRRLRDRETALGTTDTFTVSGAHATARCIGRVLLSQQGIEKLLGALAENRGFTIARKSPSGDAEEAKK